MSALVFGASTALLAACGGGGSTPGPAPAPTAAYQNRPAAAGDTFGYAGTMTETFVRPPLPAGDVTPSPNPPSTEALTTAVTQTVTVSDSVPYNGVATPFDFHTVEVDVLGSGLKTSTITSDEYYEYLAAGSKTDVYSLGSASTSSDGSSFVTKIGAGNGLVDVVPESAGTLAPPNGAAETTTEIDPDGATLERAVAANGTYTESGMNADETTTSAAANADGSGSYTFPLIIPEDSTYTVSAPAPNPSGGPDQISIVVTVPAVLVEATPSAAATPVTLDEPPIDVWYPQPLAISQQATIDEGAATLPSACDVPASLAKSANKIVATSTTVDPVFGEIDVNTTTTYTEEHIGVACVTLNDVVTQYYDLSGQAQSLIIAFDSVPFQTTTTTETLGVNAAHVPASEAIAHAATSSAARASVAGFRAVLERHRAQRRRAFYRALAARARKGAVR